VHLIVAVDGSHEGHEEFKSWIKRRDVSISEIRLYQLTLQEGVSRQVIADLNSAEIKEPKFKRLINSLLQLTPLTPTPEIQASGTEKRFKTLIIGSLPDEQNDTGF